MNVCDYVMQPANHCPGLSWRQYLPSFFMVSDDLVTDTLQANSNHHADWTVMVNCGIFNTSVLEIPYFIIRAVSVIGAGAHFSMSSIDHIDGLVQERRYSSALAMELQFSSIYPSISFHVEIVTILRTKSLTIVMIKCYVNWFPEPRLRHLVNQHQIYWTL